MVSCKPGGERHTYMFSYVKKKQEKHTDITLWDVSGYHTVHENTLETKNLSLQAAPPCKEYWLDLIDTDYYPPCNNKCLTWFPKCLESMSM